MRGKKFFSIVTKFSEDEVQSLNNYIIYRSPQKEKEILKILLFVLKCNQESYYNFTDQDVFSFVAPNCEYSDTKYRDMLHYGTQILEEYISISKVQNDPIQKKELLIEYLYENNLLKECLKEISILEKILLKNTLLVQNLKKLYELNIKRYHIENVDYFKKKKSSVEDGIFYLDSFYFIEKLRYTHELLIDQQVTNNEYHPILLNEVLSESNKPPFINNSLSKIYYIITLLYKGNYSKEKYFVLKDEVFKVFPEFDELQKRLITIDLFNYIGTISAKYQEIELIREAHIINLWALKNKCFIKNNQLNAHNAMNIANVALAIKENKWFEKFLSTNKHLIKDENLFMILTSQLALSYKDYKKAESLACKVDLKDSHYTVVVKHILVKAYFHLENYDLLDYQIKALNLYFRRTKNLNSTYKESNLNFLKKIDKLIKYINDSDKLLNLKSKVESLSNISYRIWLIENINLHLK